MKLIAGKMNIPYIILKPNYATGAELLRSRNKSKRVKPVVKSEAFNKLELIYVIRQSQTKKVA